MNERERLDVKTSSKNELSTLGSLMATSKIVAHFQDLSQLGDRTAL
tara:strand:+ start:2462 stop:2599 length:138 start_codon:yes stop_codon:yes gene_type:complete